MSPRSWHTLVPLKTKGRIECLELEKWNMRQMSAKVQRIIELLGFLRLRNTILACAFHYWSCFSLISKNFKNHLSKNLRFFRADLAFFNTYFYGVRITLLLSSTFFCPTLNFFQRPRKYFYGHYVPALGRFLLLDFEALLGPLGRARGLLRTLELLLMKAELRSLWGDVEAVGL